MNREELERILQRRHNRAAAPLAPVVPLATQNPFQTGERSFIGGFLESAASSLPELIGRDATDAAVQFRAANPVSGFVSQVLPTIGPYGGMFALSRTAKGASALSKGMQGAKAAGTALGMNTAGRPVIAAAVKEMLRYSPLELGRLGTGAIAYPENVGELFADVAVSTLFEGALGAGGAALRLAGKAKKAGEPLASQPNMLVHPMTDLRALREPEALATGATPEQIETEAAHLTARLLNDKAAPKSYIGNVRTPLFGKLKDAEPEVSLFSEALFRVNTQAKKDRGISRMKVWEGPADDPATLNPGELLKVVEEAGFASPRELAENSMTVRFGQLNDERSAARVRQLVESGAYKKYGDNAWAAETEFGSHVVIKRLPRAEDAKPKTAAAATIDPEKKALDFGIADDLDKEASILERVTARKAPDELVTPPLPGAEPATVQSLKSLAAQKRIEAQGIRKVYEPAGKKPAGKISPKKTAASAPEPLFRAGDRFLVSHTPRPGAFAPEMKRLDAAANDVYANMQRVYQPMSHQPHVYNTAMQQVVDTFTPENMRFMSQNLKQTAVAEVSKDIARRGVKVAGLEDSVAVREFVEKFYDLAAPGMFKEARNTRFGRLSQILQHVVRTGDEGAERAMYGALRQKAGSRTALNRGFVRNVDEGIAGQIDRLSPAGHDAAVKLVNAPVNSIDELKRIIDEGEVPPEDLTLLERMIQMRREFDEEYIIKPLESVKREHNYNFMEGYLGPRTPLGDWSVKVVDERGNLVYLATGKSTQQAQAIGKAFIDEGAAQGKKLKLEDPVPRHAIEIKDDETTEIMKKVGASIAADPIAADDLVAGAMKRIRFIGAQRDRRTGVRPRAPGSLAHERTGVALNTIEMSKKELKDHILNDMKRKAHFAGTTTYMDRWGNDIAGKLKDDNPKLFEDINRRVQQTLGVAGQTTRWMNKRISKIPGVGPHGATKLAGVINATLFNFQLGILQPTYALLNALSPLQTVLPQVAFMLQAPREVAQNFFQYMPLKDSAGRTVAVGAALDPIRVMWQAMKMMRNLDDEAAEVMLSLRKQGVMGPQMFEEFTVKVPQTLNESFKNGGWAEFSWNAMTSMARNSESFARIISANAGYVVGKQHLELQGAQLEHFVRKFTESTNYLYNQSDRARLITGPVGSMFGLFKNWQMHFMGMMAMYAGVAIKHGTFGPLMWQGAAAMTLGGLGATPLRHLADGLANFQEGHPDSFLWMQENLGGSWADSIFFGPLGALGISLQASSTIPGTDVRNDLQMVTTSIVIERAAQLGGAIGDGIKHYRSTGENPLADPNIRDRLMAAGAPRAVSRAASVVEGNYVKSMGTGYPMMQEPSFAARVAHGMGMNVTEIERQQVHAKALWKSQEARKGAITNYGSQMAQALKAEDWETVHRLELGAIAKELPLDRIYQSASNFERREEGDLLDRYKTEDAERRRAALEE